MLAPVTDDALLRLCRQHLQALSLAHLVEAGIDRLPLPGAGATLQRWRALSEVAAHDLSLVKLFEGHTDALAIRSELGAAPAEPGSLWGTWCAEPPDARVSLVDTGGDARLHGTKAWCSGAASVSHAVVSCWNAAGEPCLAAVAMDQAGVTVTDSGWHAVGMAASGSVDVRFDGALASPLGRPGDYVNRPGFWQGGAGIAACWFGGALGIARIARQACLKAPDPHRRAHIGAIDTALAGAAALLRESAAWIDAHPRADAREVALRTRLVVEEAAQQVIAHAGRATGAGPLCRDPRFARAMADLPVFMRQSHAERDLAALGEIVLAPESSPWKL
ncbi:acyl-CoA dehydrogenase family protein [Variovorax sp. J22P168]|uniref:acyl-CoA dehydrogenase family protein n=1 Tax=Variovorax jilinensis TaxID=3053513 RepID=UPI002575AD8D|nr:acyl-CoA dehydrogenase family protein [Variovorax sp. J22P168]MDM0014622.1 acyl-CoA dehydrogenase family protein [Variovorax sp. J22P168]